MYPSQHLTPEVTLNQRQPGLPGHFGRAVLNFFLLILLCSPLYAQANFIYTNDDVPTGNTVTGYAVAANGALTPIGTFPTGGFGSAAISAVAPGRVTVCVMDDLLFVANAGDVPSTVSVFQINPTTGALTLIGPPVSTFGDGSFTGVSLACTSDGKTLYVANADSNDITILSIGPGGILTPAPVTFNPVFVSGAFPISIKVTPDGKYLLASNNITSDIEVFTIGAGGELTLPSNGLFFAGDGAGTAAGIDINCASNLVFAGNSRFLPTLVDVFDIVPGGFLTPVAGSPFSPGTGTGTNSNVVLLSPDEKFLFVSNQGDLDGFGNFTGNTITVFSVGAGGTLTPVTGSPFVSGPSGSVPTGLATNITGTLLYVANRDNTVSVLSIAPDGSLSVAPGAPAPVATGAFGLLQSLSAYPAKSCADVAITKLASPEPVVAGTNLTYTIEVTNNGPQPAQFLTVSDTLPAGTTFVSAAAPNGVTVSAPASGGTGTVMFTFPRLHATEKVTMTITVRVCPEVACNAIISNTATVSTLSTDHVPENNSAKADSTVKSQADVAITKVGVPNPVVAGSNVTYTLQVTNNGPSNSIGTVVTDVLPKGFTVVSLNSTAGTIAASPVDPVTQQITVTANLGTLGAAGQCTTNFPTTATITIVANVPVKYPVVTVPNTATVKNDNCLVDPTPANNTAIFNTSVVPETTDPGLPVPAASGSSDQTAGSVLIFNLYTSNAANPAAENTRFNITNISVAEPATVHLFFIDGSNCSVADTYICLTPNQTASLLASDIDPGVSGYLVAVAVNRDTGLPVAFNCLIGDAYVKTASGHSANLGAEAYQALMINPAGIDAAAPTATLNFDGMNYSRMPRTLAVNSLYNAGSGSPLLVVNRMGGNLGVSAASLGSAFGIVFDELETPYSFTFQGGCQTRQAIANSFPRTTPRIGNVIPVGSTGWMKLWATDDFAITGAILYPNVEQGTIGQGRNLHHLTYTNARMVVPIFPPTCN